MKKAMIDRCPMCLRIKRFTKFVTPTPEQVRDLLDNYDVTYVEETCAKCLSAR